MVGKRVLYGAPEEGVARPRVPLYLSRSLKSLDSAYKKGEKDVAELGIAYLASEHPVAYIRQFPAYAVLHPISAMDAVVRTAQWKLFCTHPVPLQKRCQAPGCQQCNMRRCVRSVTETESYLLDELRQRQRCGTTDLAEHFLKKLVESN